MMPQSEKVAQAHPRIIHKILEQASWTDDPAVQALWAGLFVSSCTEDGEDDSNLIFINLLTDMTRLQAKVIKYACENCSKHEHGYLLIPTQCIIKIEEFHELFGEKDFQRINRELDKLRAIGLLDLTASGIDRFRQEIISLAPTELALHMYIRCSGSRESPVEFFTRLAREKAESKTDPAA
jgi:hypothetical protein